LYKDFTSFGQRSLLDNNQEFNNRLNKWQVDGDLVTAEQNPVVTVIDFDGF
jgi:hypothetical protein